MEYVYAVVYIGGACAGHHLVRVDGPGSGVMIDLNTVGEFPLGECTFDPNSTKLVRHPHKRPCKCGSEDFRFDRGEGYTCNMCGLLWAEPVERFVNRWAPPPTYPGGAGEIPDFLNPDSLQYAPPWPRE